MKINNLDDFSSFALLCVIAKPCETGLWQSQNNIKREIASSLSLPALLNATGNQRS